MNIILEHIIAIIILIALISSTMYFTITTLRSPVQYVSTSFLEREANILIDKILLSPGSPPDWGSRIKVYTQGSSLIVKGEKPKIFGLAKVNGSLYEIDPSKIARLKALADPTIPIPSSLALDSEDILKALGLDPKEYGICFRIIPAVNANIVQKTYFTRNPYGNVYLGGYKLIKSLKLKLRDYSSRIAANATVNIFYHVYMTRIAIVLNWVNGIPQVTPIIDPLIHVAKNYTYVSDWKGDVEANLESILEEEPNATLLFKYCFIFKEYLIFNINYQSLKSYMIYVEKKEVYEGSIDIINFIEQWSPKVYKGYMVGQYVFSEKNIIENITGYPDADIVLERGPWFYSLQVVGPYVINVSVIKFNETIHDADKTYYCYKLEYVDPLASNITIMYRDLRFEVLIEGIPPQIKYRFIYVHNEIQVERDPTLFYGKAPDSPVSTSTGRIVKICGYTYYFELILWKRTGG
ncbi:MAG: hypothetical protein DRJ32_03305 [Thermoprotei archaeon]|nr:MAG: hypothetical protein DRJ32_03305 [Thermoprotei archaeon]